MEANQKAWEVSIRVCSPANGPKGEGGTEKGRLNLPLSYQRSLAALGPVPKNKAGHICPFKKVWA